MVSAQPVRRYEDVFKALSRPAIRSGERDRLPTDRRVDRRFSDSKNPVRVALGDIGVADALNHLRRRIADGEFGKTRTT